MTGRNIPKNGFKVLVVDPDPSSRATLSAGLRREGFLTAEASQAAKALSMIDRNRPDLVIVDIDFPEADGFKFIENLRSHDSIPVVVCTARAEKKERIASLEVGADDYISKPFSPRELIVRVKTVLRRATNSLNAESSTPSIEFGDVVIEPDTHEIRKAGFPLVVTAKEFDLIFFMATNPGVTYSRAELLEAVWASSAEFQSEATVTEHIRRLRVKIESDAGKPYHIETVRGEGYRFKA